MLEQNLHMPRQVKWTSVLSITAHNDNHHISHASNILRKFTNKIGALHSVKHSSCQWTFGEQIAICLSSSLHYSKITSYLLQTWMSVSNENNTSESRRWWMYDHLNSGIRNGGLVGPGLNMGRDELCTIWQDFERFDSETQYSFIFLHMFWKSVLWSSERYNANSIRKQNGRRGAGEWQGPQNIHELNSAELQ